MKKIVSLMLTVFIAAQCLVAQVPEGIKYLNYAKYKSAKDAFQKAYAVNPKDAQTIYWLGQAILATDGSTPVTPQQLQEAKALYQKGLQEVGSDPWLLVGMGHVELMGGGDLNSAKQKFEQAITASTATSGRTKGKPNPAILNAIGRANALLPSGKGDNVYAIDKLKLAATLDPLSADIYTNLGINYLKMGGENGGEAVKAFQEALARDPKNAFAFYRIGKIYQSQNNKDLFEQNFNSAIGVDPTFPQVYNALFDYYASRDVNKAKEYLDKYIANADKSPENDVYLAEYLFRAQKNTESLAKLKEVEAAAGANATNLAAINLLYAYNYDRLGDSVQAKANLEKYFANPNAKIRPEDYDLAVKVFSKFPGSETTAIGYLEKALTADTSKENRIAYMGQVASLYGKAKMVPKQIEWLQKQAALKGGSISEYDYYNITKTAFEQ
jgi:Tfp pilus assembly protein PilF